jgi:hypothetical protein
MMWDMELPIIKIIVAFMITFVLYGTAIAFVYGPEDGRKYFGRNDYQIFVGICTLIFWSIPIYYYRTYLSYFIDNIHSIDSIVVMVITLSAFLFAISVAIVGVERKSIEKITRIFFPLTFFIIIIVYQQAAHHFCH